MDHFNPDGHYAASTQQQQQQHQSQGQQQPWQLMPVTTAAAAAVAQQAPFSSPVVSPSTGPGESSAYPAFYHPSPRIDTAAAAAVAARMPLDRTSSSASSALSLNMSGLSVTSPTAASPIHPPSLHSTHSNSTASSTLSPVTPISPTSSSFSGLHAAAVAASSTSSQAQHHHPYSFTATPSYDDHPAHHHHHQQQQHHAHQLHHQLQPPHHHAYRVGPGSLGGAPEKHIPRKRSFTNSGAGGGPQSVPEEPEPASSSSYHDDMNSYPSVSPVDGSNSGGEVDDFLSPASASSSMQHQHHANHQQQRPSTPQNLGTGMHKPVGTHNFVTKLYMMINDPKSSHLISWTELGNSFVVSNVGEFSRSILGAHFKHNNFSSFVRQLNMYGFHKINRTPRAQRTSNDAQTWEFSHHKFLRGRPDLLEEIKRKALLEAANGGPGSTGGGSSSDAATRHRIELPGELAAQLSQVREENRRVRDALMEERRRTERLVGVVKTLWDVVAKGVPGNVPMPFPADLLESLHSSPSPTSPAGVETNPNIYVTSPTMGTNLSTRYLPPLNSSAARNTPPSEISPTAADFQLQPHADFSSNGYSQYPHHHHHHHHQQHQQQQQQQQLPPPPLHIQHQQQRYTPTPSSTGPPSPSTMDFSFDDEYDQEHGMDADGAGAGGNHHPKRQRFLEPEDSGSAHHHNHHHGRRISRARSDSAPLGYSLAAWNSAGAAGAPRSSTRAGGLAARGSVPNMSSAAAASAASPSMVQSSMRVPTLSVPVPHHSGPASSGDISPA